MHFRAQLLQPLLVSNAEMLLLVDNDEAKILEAHGLAQDGVSADDNVDSAFSQALLYLTALSRADHARELANVDWEPCEAEAEVLGMLTRQERGRGDNRGLLAVDGCREGGAQRDLGLAEANVAAHQPVHRPARGQIVERRLNRAFLVGRLVVGKGGAKLVGQA